MDDRLESMLRRAGKESCMIKMSGTKHETVEMGIKVKMYRKSENKRVRK